MSNIVAVQLAAFFNEGSEEFIADVSYSTTGTATAAPKGRKPIINEINGIALQSKYKNCDKSNNIVKGNQHESHNRKRENG